MAKKSKINKNTHTVSGNLQTATVTPPKADANGIEEAEFEEVKEEKKEDTTTLTPPKLSDLVEKMEDSDTMDANHAAVFLSALERRVSKMKPNQPLTVKMENVLDYNMAWYAVRLAIQTTKEKKRFQMLTPADETMVQEFIDTFSSIGVALEAHPTNSGQMALEFKEISEETKKAVEEENKASATTETKTEESSAPTEATSTFKYKTWTEDDLNPDNWVNDTEACAALKHVLNIPGQSPSIRFLNALAKLRLYRKKCETDETKKEAWDTIGVGELAKDFVALMGTKNISIVINGIGSAITNSMATDGTVIFAHSIIRKNMKALSDKEASDLVKAFVEINNPDKKYEETLAVKNGIDAVDREKFVRIVKQEPDASKNEDIKTFKKIFNPFYMIYHEEVGTKTITDKETNALVANPDFEIKAVNKMIEIHNLYLDESKQFNLYTQAEFDGK